MYNLNYNNSNNNKNEGNVECIYVTLLYQSNIVIYLAYYVPDTLLGTLHVLIHLSITYMPRNLIQYSHFIDEETHLWRGYDA